MEINPAQLEMIQAYEETRKTRDDFLTILSPNPIEAQIRRTLKVRCEKQIQNFMKHPGLAATLWESVLKSVTESFRELMESIQKNKWLF